MVYETTLSHHGILGQKWGVRRFQNPNGSLTSAGKRRYNNNNNTSNSDSKRKGMSSSTKKKLIVGAVLTAATVATIYGIENPNVAKSIAKAATMPLKSAKKLTNTKTVKLVSDALKNSRTIDLVKKGTSKSLTAIKSATSNEKVKDFLKKSGSKSLTVLKNSGTRVGNAMIDAALLSVGTIAISKLAKRLTPDDDASEKIKDRNKIILDTTSAGITALTKANHGSNNNFGNKNGGSVGKEISSAIGEPSKKGNAKQDPKYNTLFKDSNGNQRSDDVRTTIKSMASAGYDVDQIQSYLNMVDNGTLKHSCDDVLEWLNYCRAVNIVDAITT